MITDEVYEAIAEIGENCARILEEMVELLKPRIEKIVDEISAFIIFNAVHDTPYVPKCKLGRMLFCRIVKPRARSCC